MESIIHIEQWHELFFMLGSSAGALVGLLFIVMSLHLDAILDQADDSIRFTMEGARNNTYHLLTVLVEAALVLTPQPVYLLGAELIVINLYGLRLPIGIANRFWRKNVSIGERKSFPITSVVTISFAYLIGMSGGLALIRELSWGMYHVSASLMLLIVRSVLTAWMLMFVKKRTDNKE